MQTWKQSTNQKEGTNKNSENINKENDLEDVWCENEVRPPNGSLSLSPESPLIPDLLRTLRCFHGGCLLNLNPVLLRAQKHLKTNQRRAAAEELPPAPLSRRAPPPAS